MTGKKIVVTAALAAGAALLGGCEQLGELELFKEKTEWAPRESDAISVSREGVITEYIQEELDASYYSASELETMINSEVGEYNSQNGADSVKVVELSAEGNAFKLTMEYASGTDFAQFNNTEFYLGSMINAQLAGYLFDVSYKKVESGAAVEDIVSGSEVIKEMDKTVLVLQAPMEVHVPGEVLYISANAEVLSSDVINATGKEEEEAQELLLPSNDVYISGGSSMTVAEAEAANRVYIIYDED